MKLIDTHAHLYLHHFNDDIEDVIKRTKENGVNKVILPNIDSNTVEPMLKLTQRFPGFLFPAIGLHPGSVKENYLEDLNKVEDWIKREKFFAVGEIGIDCYWDKTFLKEQISAFEFQTGLAQRYHLPVIIHCRDSFDLIIESLLKFQGKVTGVFHAFTGNNLQAKKIIELGFKIGIGGVVTFKNSGLSKAIADIRLFDILLETDSPYLTPAPHRGKRNESSYLIHIAEKIAEIKNIPAEKVAEITTQNSNLLFGLD